MSKTKRGITKNSTKEEKQRNCLLHSVHLVFGENESNPEKELAYSAIRQKNHTPLQGTPTGSLQAWSQYWRIAW
jgi:hypothetical protein